MLLKDSHSQSSFFSSSNARNLLSTRRRIKALAVATAMVLFFLGGILFHRTGAMGQVIIPELKKLAYPINYMSGLVSNPQQMKIDISYKNYQKLAYTRKLALERDMLLPEFRNEVPADIRVGNKTVKVKLRLKGDMSDHWKHRYKWSFRIRTRGENTLFGMKQFSIQNPATRGFLNEWVFHKLLKEEGFVALRYDFIEVTVNGKNQGIYALEEHFEKRLLENNGRREGPIIRFDNYMRWAGDFLPGSIGLNNAFYQAPIDAFQSKKIRKSETYRQQFLLAKDLLESFRLGDLKVAEVFDAKKVAMLFAVVDVFGYQHSMEYGNIRFYYNPVTSLLEPIGYDQQTIRDVSYSLLEGEEIELSNRMKNVWIANFFRDAEFYVLYVKALQKVSDEAYLDKFFEKVRPEMNNKLAILHKSFPSYSFNDELILRSNQQYIRKVLNPIQGIHAYFEGADQNNITLSVANIHSLPLEVLGLSFPGSQYSSLMHKRVFSPKVLLMPPEFVPIKFARPENFNWSDSLARKLRVAYRIVGTDSVRYEPVYPWTYRSPNFLKTDFVRQAPNVSNFNFLVVDEQARKIVIKPGAWKLSQSLIIPAGYVVTCFENTSLDLTQSARILSYSPVSFRGTEEAPIMITSSDSSGQGVIVMNAGQESILEWVVFDNLANPSHNMWKLSGAVTFYESPVEIYDCQFSNNRCEDGLNVVRSDVSINRTVFKGTLSDAFDGDFVTATIDNCSFVNCGNDAIDVSGSILKISNTYIDGAGDKGLSIGEDSRAEAHDIEIKNAEIAFASKDLSQLLLENVTLTDCTVGFTVYKKKPEFGAARLEVTGLKISNVEVPYVVEELSTLFVDGEKIQPNQKAVEEILYGVQYGKSSK